MTEADVEIVIERARDRFPAALESIHAEERANSRKQLAGFDIGRNQLLEHRLHNDTQHESKKLLLHLEFIALGFFHSTANRTGDKLNSETSD